MRSRLPRTCATPWRRLVNPFRMREPRVRVEQNVPYNEAYGRRGMLDIYVPADTPLEGAPVLLQVHGGGWTIGTKDQQGIPLMQHLAAKGWICVAPQLPARRRATRGPRTSSTSRSRSPGSVRTSREYGGDPDYIAITGGSAGGHLAALAAVTANDREWQPGFEDVDTSVQAAIPHYGVYDFAGVHRDPRVDPDARPVPGATGVQEAPGTKDPEVFEAASPLLRVTPDAPDFFVLHGVARHPGRRSTRPAGSWRSCARSRSATVVYAELPGTQHAFDVFPSIRSAHVVRAIDRYLHWHWNGYRRERA